MNIFAFARAQEIRAETTYRECAANATDAALKAVFTLLAEAEKHHQEVIRELEQKKPASIAISNFLGDSKFLIEKLAPNKSALRVAASQVDVYKEARRQEEEAEAFYRSKAQESTEAVRDILNALADQESEHFQVLDWLVELIGHPEANLENAEFNKRS